MLYQNNTIFLPSQKCPHKNAIPGKYSYYCAACCVVYLGMPTNFKITKVNQLHISGAKIGRNLCLDNIVLEVRPTTNETISCIFQSKHNHI